MTPLHIGLDLDNTIIDYSRVFALAGEETGLLRAGHGLAGKEEVKAYLQNGPGGEEAWMRLQGQVYGRCIGMACMFDGVRAFLETAAAGGARISIVSHKTQYGHFDPGRVHLWEAARRWLEDQGCFAGVCAIDPADVHFLETRREKIARISEIGCEVFVDDLPEVLNDAAFPARVGKLWFASTQPAEAGEGLKPYRSWAEISEAVAKRL